jgi:uncharacterized protein (DUF433 family)
VFWVGSGEGFRESAEPGQTAIAAVYAAAAEQNPHIGSNPNILSGKPCIKGTRIPVALVLRYLAVGDDPVEDLELTKKDVSDCLEFAATVCDQPTSRGD